MLGSFLIAFVIALALTLIFVVGLGSGRGNGADAWGSFLLFLFIIWAGTWAIGSWVLPVGPVAYGLPWVSFLVIGLLVALIAAAATATATHHVPASGRWGDEAPTEGARSLAVFGLFFWLLLLLVVLAILARYAWAS